MRKTGVGWKFPSLMRTSAVALVVWLLSSCGSEPQRISPTPPPTPVVPPVAAAPSVAAAPPVAESPQPERFVGTWTLNTKLFVVRNHATFVKYIKSVLAESGKVMTEKQIDDMAWGLDLSDAPSTTFSFALSKNGIAKIVLDENQPSAAAEWSFDGEVLEIRSLGVGVKPGERVKIFREREGALENEGLSSEGLRLVYPFSKDK